MKKKLKKMKLPFVFSVSTFYHEKIVTFYAKELTISIVFSTADSATDMMCL